MKKKIVGYLVVGIDDEVLELDRLSESPDTVLVRGDGATLFPTRQAARSAIRRTVKFAKTHLSHLMSIRWSRERWTVHEITPVTSE